MPEPQDSMWEPAYLADIAPMGTARIAALDAGNAHVTVFDSAFGQLRSFGRSGAGPVEFRGPTSIAWRPKDAQLLVADGGNGRILVFDTAGQPVRTIAANLAGVEDIAATDDATFLSHQIVPEMITLGEHFRRVLSRVDERRPVLDSIVMAPTRDLDARWYPLPGPNRFRLAATGAALLLFSPASGVVDVLESGVVRGSLGVCYPQALEHAYADQRERHIPGVSGNGQQWYPLITDVLARDDTIYAVGPLPDRDDHFHVDRFTLDGSYRGSVVASMKGTSLPQDVRFWDAPYVFASFGRYGTIIRMELRLDE